MVCCAYEAYSGPIKTSQYVSRPRDREFRLIGGGICCSPIRQSATIHSATTNPSRFTSQVEVAIATQKQKASHEEIEKKEKSQTDRADRPYEKQKTGGATHKNYNQAKCFSWCGLNCAVLSAICCLLFFDFREYLCTFQNAICVYRC